MAVEGGPIAQAAAELVMDVSSFGPDVKRKVTAAAAAAGKDFDRELIKATQRTGGVVGNGIWTKVEDGAGRGGVRAGQEFDRGVRAATRRTGTQLGRSGTQAGFSWGNAFKTALALVLTGALLRGVFAPLEAVGKGLGLATVGAGAAAAAAGLLQIVAAAAPATGVLLLIPALAVAAGAGLLTLRVALSGMGEAFSAALSGDPRKFAEAIESLSPAARLVAQEFQRLVPELHDIRDATQEAFFGPLQGRLTAIAATLLGPVRSGMVGVSAASAQVALGLGDIAAQAPTTALVAGGFDLARLAVAALLPGVLAIVLGVRDLGVVALPLLSQMSAATGGVAVQFGQWLSAIAASGQAVTWIQQALATLAQFGQLLLQVGGIIGAVLGAAQTSGAGALVTLTELLHSVNAFLSGTAGQTALVSIFTSLSQVGAALSPVLTALLVQLGLIAPFAAQIAVALGPGLASAVGSLGQALVGLGPGFVAIAAGLSQGLIAAGPGIIALAGALGMLLGSVGPLLPQLGLLVGLVAGVLGQALVSVTPALIAVAGVVLRLLTAVAPLIPVLGQLVAVVAVALVQALDALLPAIEPIVAGLVSGLAPVLPELARAFAGLVAAVAPLLPPLGALIGFVLRLAGIALAFQFKGLADAFELIAAVIGPVVAGISRFVSYLGSLDFGAIAAGIGGAFAGAGAAILGFFRGLPGQVGRALLGLGRATGSAFTSAGQAIQDFLTSLPGMLLRGLAGLGRLWFTLFTSALQLGLQAIGIGIALIIQAFIVLPGLIGRGLVALPGVIAGAFAAAWRLAVDATTAAVAAIVAWLAGLGRDVGSILSALPGQVGGFFRDAFASGKAWVLDGVTVIVGYVSTLPGRIGGFLSGLPGQIGAIFRNAFASGKQWALDGVNTIVGYIAGLPGRIGAFAGQMFDAGARLGSRLLDGLRQLGSFVSGLGRALLNYVIDGINRGISSAWKLPGAPPQIPRMAKGAIVDKATLALLGEAGREVVIPLTKPARAVQLAADSGLLDLLIRQGALRPRGGDGAVQQVVINAPITVQAPYSDPELVALATVDRLLREAEL